MIPTGFEGENAVLDRPDSMTVDQCEPLSVMRAKTEDGLPVVISCWKATAEELAEINRTGRVWLVVFGPSMQPARLCGAKPFEHPGMEPA